MALSSVLESSNIDRTVEVDVEGMTCGHCVASVTKALEAIKDVKNIEVILEPEGVSKVTVITDVDLDDETITKAVDEAGFTVVDIRRDK